MTDLERVRLFVADRLRRDPGLVFAPVGLVALTGAKPEVVRRAMARLVADGVARKVGDGWCLAGK